MGAGTTERRQMLICHSAGQQREVVDRRVTRTKEASQARGTLAWRAINAINEALNHSRAIGAAT